MIINLVFGFIESRWKPFAVVFSFFIVGFANTKEFLLFWSGEVSRRSLLFVGVMDVLAISYLAWLCVRTSFYIQPRAKAIAYALIACGLGAVIACADGM